MDAIDFIQEHVNPSTILTHYNFRHIKETEDAIRACCEIHKGTNPNGFVWNKRNNLWYCYTGDCYGGDVFNLIQKMEQVDFETAVRTAAQILGLDIDNMIIDISGNRLKREQKQWMMRQRSLVENNANIVSATYILPYTKYYYTNSHFQRFSQDTLQFYEAKFCKLYPIDEAMLQDKLVIPIIQHGICVGAALRDTTGHVIPKWLFQPKGVSMGSLLYNLDNAEKLILSGKTNSLILVEGIFDVWAYHQIGMDNAVAVFGSTVSKQQYKTIMTMGADVIMSFDNDDAGHKCTKALGEKLKNKVGLFIVNLPPGSDPADCSEQELLSAYLNRKQYST